MHVCDILTDEMGLNKKVFLILPCKLKTDKPSKLFLCKRQIHQTC